MVNNLFIQYFIPTKAILRSHSLLQKL